MSKKCTSCKYHEIIPDPDPYDWFCDDDCAIRCLKSTKTPQVTSGGSYKMTEPMITAGCRPYNTIKEADVPDWCPLNNKEITD